MALQEKNHIIYESVPVRISALRHAKIGYLLVLGPPTPGFRCALSSTWKNIDAHSLLCYGRSPV